MKRRFGFFSFPVFVNLAAASTVHSEYDIVVLRAIIRSLQVESTEIVNFRSVPREPNFISFTHNSSLILRPLLTD